MASVISFRIFTCLCGNFNGETHQLDVSTAFLNGKLDKEVFLELPEALRIKYGKQFVWKTKTSIYGLAQSPKVWNKTVDKFLVDFGLARLSSEQCLYTHWEQGKLDFILIL